MVNAPSRGPGLQLAAAGLAALAAAVGAPAEAAWRSRSYEQRIADIDLIMNRFYRGETMKEAHGRANALVGDFNDMIDRKNAELDRAKAGLDADGIASMVFAALGREGNALAAARQS